MRLSTAIAFYLTLSTSAFGTFPVANRAISLEGDGWWLAPDPKNAGVDEKWWGEPRPEAKPTKVPWTIQSVFPGYAGPAWYWRDLVMPANPHAGGRYLLRFWDVDYAADVWVNGTHIGRHEGAQTRFTFDATAAVKPGGMNRVAIRVLSVWGTMEGIVRAQTPHGGYRDLNLGGILDSVELVIAPQVRFEDLFVRADPNSGQIRIAAAIRNESTSVVKGSVEFSVAPATGGEPVGTVHLAPEIQPGDSIVCAEMQIAKPRLWELNDPNLYRMQGRVAAAGSASVDEASTRFGFRDFRFENGYFRLNGRRVFWRSAHTGADTPITIRVPYDPGLLRRDLLNLKAMGFNGVRFISIMGQRYQLDMCDEIGLMVYEESHASWMLEDSPQLAERMNSSITGMIRRDRNHPSVVIWGLLNETGDGPAFQHAVASLPLVRRLDDSRVVMLGSGRFDTMHFMNGLQVWKPETGFAPCLTHNPKPYAISCVTLWRSNEVSLVPGVNGEYSAARWTAPADGEYTVSARFRGTGTYTTTDVHVLVAGKPVFDSFINLQGRGDESVWRATLPVSKGQALDFVVGGRTPAGGAWYERWGNNTSLAVTIRAAGGEAGNLAAEFSNSSNPNGAWSYGWLAAGPVPDASTFSSYPKCEAEKYDSPGGISNPGSDRWEDILGDQHYYPRVPHRELEIARLRNISINDNTMFLSEYGIGSGVDLTRFVRHHEQLGVESGERLNIVKGVLATFLGDWGRLKLADTFASPEDFFRRCVAREGGLKTLGINAIRSNPNIVGYGMTGCNDPLEFGEGAVTAFRELKPGTMDAVFDAFYPVHWCTFVEPVNVYRGSNVLLEAVLANEDSAPPGQYPVRVQVVDPNNRRVLDRIITVAIPGHENGKEPAFAIPAFREALPVDGPTGKYRFLVTFQKGVAASGGESVFHVTDPADMPRVEAEIALWGDDPELSKWLEQHGLRARSYQPGTSDRRETILVSCAPNAGGTAEAWRDLAARIAQGSVAVFLTPDVFKKDGHALGWLPLPSKGSLAMVSEYTFPQVYPKDEWAKKHPLFDGLPCGGLMDYTFYREIIPDLRYGDHPTPEEAVAGSFRTSHPGAYGCDLMLAVHQLGEGRFVLNALRVRQELGRDPTAERLLRNMLRYAARDVDKPPVPVPDDFAAHLKTLGY